MNVVFMSLALAVAPCPQNVTDAAKKAHPEAKLSVCKQEVENGKTQYEVKLDAAGGKKLELDVSPEGQILQTEEKLAVAAVDKAVLSSFESKYPGVKASDAEKQTKADGSVTYELKYTDAKGKHEATFKADGTFVEEEKPEGGHEKK